MAETTQAATLDRSAAALAAGKITAIKGGQVVFLPANTSYELYLNASGYTGPVHKSVKGIIRVKARKVWTVPSGGNFIAPIFGPPRIIQGRVRSISDGRIIVQAGTNIMVDLPNDDIVYDLAYGPIAVGTLVNVTAMPGASFEVVG